MLKEQRSRRCCLKVRPTAGVSRCHLTIMYLCYFSATMVQYFMMDYNDYMIRYDFN